MILCYQADIFILSKLLTKLKPESTEIQSVNYEMGLQDIITLDDSANAIINITAHEQVSFYQTSNINNLHQDFIHTGKVSKGTWAKISKIKNISLAHPRHAI